MFYDNFVRLCNRMGKSPSSVATEIGLSRASVSGWKNGKKPTDATAMKLADYLGVSVDYLLGNEQKEKPATDSDGLTEADRRDIAIELEQLMNEMTRSGNLMFDGDPATPEAMESLRNAMEMGLIYAKKINKDKLGK